MALPAGRYGVTKNQLLKIKKLPMNTIKLIEELTEKYDLVTIKKISVTPSTGITFNTANAIKIFDKLIMINIVIDSISLSTGSATQIGYVETSARPSKEIYTTGVSNNSTPIRIAINTNGSIFVAPQTAITSGKVGFSLIYEI